jgi:hypothetical protein
MIAHGRSSEGSAFCSALSAGPGDVEPDPFKRALVCKPWPGYRRLFL